MLRSFIIKAGKKRLLSSQRRELIKQFRKHGGKLTPML